MGKKVVFFDRDGTLIEDKIYLNDPEQIFYLPNVIPALQQLRDAGFEFVIVTNQSGVARGIVDPKNIQIIHNKIRAHFAEHGIDILDFYYAPYLPVTDHYMRKPKPGMLKEASFEHGIDLSTCWMVGDRMTDVEAGHRAGGRSILLSDLESPKDFPFDPPEAHVHDLLEISEFICQNS